MSVKAGLKRSVILSTMSNATLNADQIKAPSSFKSKTQRSSSPNRASNRYDDPHISNQQQRPVTWYRTPIEPKTLRTLHERSDWMGLTQTLSYLGLLVFTGIAALYGIGRLHWTFVVAIIFMHGTVSAFLINGVHELGHGTVFKTKSLNAFFMKVLAFLGWINFEIFHASHARHHRYTLHPPDDLEVVLPIKVLVKHFFLQGFINPVAAYEAVKETVRIARGKFRGKWELTLFPEGDDERRHPMNWARTLLIGHGLILAISIYYRLWLLPVVTTLAPFYGGWLFFLCNNTQHIGLQDNVPDFRLCCRTFILNPFVRLLYWQMNYHTEHHMYAAVPCYRLGKLHELIKHDLPPCPKGIIATWKEIAAIQRKQEADPSYQHIASLPNR
jgi:fatty acid desaturase